MCVVSMITEHYQDRWIPFVPRPWEIGPTNISYPPPQSPNVDLDKFNLFIKNLQPKEPLITPEEVAEFRRLLERAREYDKRNNEPHCELAEKKTALKAIAAQLGVDISFIDEERV